MKKMTIILVVVIIAQFILTLCYKEKSIIIGYGFERANIMFDYKNHINVDNINNSVIYIEEDSFADICFYILCEVKHLKSEDNVPRVLDQDENMCNVYYNGELLYNDTDHFDELYGPIRNKDAYLEEYKRTKNFFGVDVRLNYQTARVIPLIKSGEYKIEMFLKVRIGAEEVMKKDSINFTVVRLENTKE